VLSPRNFAKSAFFIGLYYLGYRVIVPWPWRHSRQQIEEGLLQAAYSSYPAFAAVSLLSSSS
jgi:hypothetical protein